MAGRQRPRIDLTLDDSSSSAPSLAGQKSRGRRSLRTTSNPISPPPARRNGDSSVSNSARAGPSRRPSSARRTTVAGPSNAAPESFPQSDPMDLDSSPKVGKRRKNAKPSPQVDSMDLDDPLPTQRVWSEAEIVDFLAEGYEKLKDDRARLTCYYIDEAERLAVDHRERISDAPQNGQMTRGRDLFADLKPQTSSEPKDGYVCIKTKRIVRGLRKSVRKNIWVKLDTLHDKTQPVPSYRFMHVELGSNILAPHSTLRFIPHVRDIEEFENSDYDVWLAGLEEMDRLSGGHPLGSEEKKRMLVKNEQAARLWPYIGRWLQQLGLDSQGCDLAGLVDHVVQQKRQHQDAATQLSASKGKGKGKPLADSPARIFVEAFNKFFGESNMGPQCVTIEDVLRVDEKADKKLNPDDEEMDSEDKETEGKPPDDLAIVEKTLESHSYLACTICFSHACEHGEYETRRTKGGLVANHKRANCILNPCDDDGNHCTLVDILRRNRSIPVDEGSRIEGPGFSQPCDNECFVTLGTGDDKVETAPWKEADNDIVRTTVIAMTGGKIQVRPECWLGAIFNRRCWDVRRQVEKLNIAKLEPLPPLPPSTKRGGRSVPWYNRYTKRLVGDWQQATLTHEPSKREMLQGCFHPGQACDATRCPCFKASVMCEKACYCRVEDCPIKFTGCACHGEGQLCSVDSPGQKCICLQLNRECDPDLCRSCGAGERGDPINRDNGRLHQSGCQNVELQRRRDHVILLGKSQLDGVGFGAFAGEDIAAGDFVIEYVGELITQDEGVKREARRGDNWTSKKSMSYVFTLLEEEGMWVDSAMYGNNSRYLNHADEGSCNLASRYVYVNGEWRIKFLALREIKAGEELFFNYGDHFPHLTKKLMDDNAGKAKGKAKAAQGPPRKPPSGKSASKHMRDANSDGDDSGGRHGSFGSFGSSRPTKHSQSSQSRKVAPYFSRTNQLDWGDTHGDEGDGDGDGDGDDDDDYDENEYQPPGQLESESNSSVADYGSRARRGRRSTRALRRPFTGTRASSSMTTTTTTTPELRPSRLASAGSPQVAPGGEAKVPRGRGRPKGSTKKRMAELAAAAEAARAAAAAQEVQDRSKVVTDEGAEPGEDIDMTDAHGTNEQGDDDQDGENGLPPLRPRRSRRSSNRMPEFYGTKQDTPIQSSPASSTSDSRRPPSSRKKSKPARYAGEEDW